MKRRDLLLALAAAGAGFAASMPPRRVEILAQKFEFVPAEIMLPAGRPVTLVLAAHDFTHGFAMPDFGIRRDLIPGRPVEVTITPRKAGRYHYLCDNFCGDGHDRMSGILAVIDG